MSEAQASVDRAEARSVGTADRLATAVIAARPDALLPAVMQERVEQAVQRAAMLKQMVGRVLEEGTDYGKVPGNPKPTLLQPGAQQLAFVFGLTQKFSVETERIDYGQDPPFISYTVKCQMISRETGEVMAEGLAACNSLEVRYRYRNEWQNGTKVRVVNQEVADLQNTILKMASKRANVAATLNATAASRLFTQDLEDLRGMEEAARDETSAQAQQQRTQRTAPASPQPQTQAAQRLPSERQVAFLTNLLRRHHATKRVGDAVLAACTADAARCRKAIDALNTDDAGALDRVWALLGLPALATQAPAAQPQPAAPTAQAAPTDDGDPLDDLIREAEGLAEGAGMDAETRDAYIARMVDTDAAQAVLEQMREAAVPVPF